MCCDFSSWVNNLRAAEGSSFIIICWLSAVSSDLCVWGILFESIESAALLRRCVIPSAVDHNLIVDSIWAHHTELKLSFVCVRRRWLVTNILGGDTCHHKIISEIAESTKAIWLWNTFIDQYIAVLESCLVSFSYVVHLWALVVGEWGIRLCNGTVPLESDVVLNGNLCWIIGLKHNSNRWGKIASEVQEGVYW
jgi:hypothetical protein